jgi:hypothetical protein
MLRFGSVDSEKPRRPATNYTYSRVWQLVSMLIVAVALMAWLGFRAHEAERREQANRDLLATPVVTETFVESDRASSDDSDEVRMLEMSRLREFVDHDRALAAEPYYYLLDLARHNPAEWLETHARRDLTWAHLLREPDKYRGQLVLLRGRLLRLTRDDCGENDYGLTTRYEGWVATEESGKYSYAVIVTEPPTGLALGTPNDSVAVAGYFLGWWRHPDQNEKLTSSPIILGRRLVTLKQPMRPDVAISPAYGIAIGAAIVVLALGSVYFGFRRGRSPVAESLQRDAGPLEFVEQPIESEPRS